MGKKLFWVMAFAITLAACGAPVEATPVPTKVVLIVSISTPTPPATPKPTATQTPALTPTLGSTKPPTLKVVYPSIEGVFALYAPKALSKPAKSLIRNERIEVVGTMGEIGIATKVPIWYVVRLEGFEGIDLYMYVDETVDKPLGPTATTLPPPLP